MGIGLKGRRARWLVAGAVVAAVGFTSAGAYALTGDEPAAPARTGTARVDRGEVASAVATTGSLEPAQTRSLGFATSGTVTSVNVRPGDQVKSGQVLAEIDPAEARERVDDAEESLAEAQEALAEADSSTCLTAGAGGGSTAAPSASPSASPSPSPSLSPSPPPSISPSRPAPASPGGGPSASAGSGCANRGGDPILTAQQRVTSAELALAEAEEQLSGTAIKAPIAGKVLTVAGSVGGEVDGGGTFVTLADVAGMQVAASFPEADAGRLAVGLSATVTLANRPGEEFAATVVQTDPVGTADGDMVTYGAVLAFDQVPSGLLVGQSANVRVKTSSVADALRVPSTAVRVDGTVLVRTTAGDEARRVEVGVRGDQFTEIKGGLIEGDEIVIAGS